MVRAPCQTALFGRDVRVGFPEPFVGLRNRRQAGFFSPYRIFLFIDKIVEAVVEGVAGFADVPLAGIAEGVAVLFELFRKVREIFRRRAGRFGVVVGNAQVLRGPLSVQQAVAGRNAERGWSEGIGEDDAVRRQLVQHRGFQLWMSGELEAVVTVLVGVDKKDVWFFVHRLGWKCSFLQVS